MKYPRTTPYLCQNLRTYCIYKLTSSLSSISHLQQSLKLQLLFTTSKYSPIVLISLSLSLFFFFFTYFYPNLQHKIRSLFTIRPPEARNNHRRQVPDYFCSELKRKNSSPVQFPPNLKTNFPSMSFLLTQLHPATSSNGTILVRLRNLVYDP